MNPSQVQVLIAVAEVLVKSAAILAAGLGVNRLLRARQPGRTNGVLVIALTASLAVALFSPIVPGVTVLYLPGRVEGLPTSRNQPVAAPATGGIAPQAVETSASKGSGLDRASTEGPGAPLEGLALIWGVGAAYVVGRTLWNLHRLTLIRRFGAEPAGSDIVFRMANLKDRLAIDRKCQVLVSLTDLPETPVTWGLLEPTILLPKGAEEWPRERLDSVLLHELAHVKGDDVAFRLFAELACAAYWFQPLAWKTAAQMRDDAEMAADEAVLRCDVKPSDYADTLLWMASTIGHSRKNHPYQGVPAMNPSRLETRLKLVLSDRSRERGTALVAGIAAATCVAALAPLLALLHASQTNAPTNLREQRQLAFERAKTLALATLMYGQDYDDHYPYVQSTQDASFALKPYVATPDQLYPNAPKAWTQKAMATYLARPYLTTPDVFRSPTPGGRFTFNLNLGGVVGADVPRPAATPLWVESLPDKTQPFAVCFADGHAQLVQPGSKTQQTNITTPDGGPPLVVFDPAAVEKALTWKFPRRADSKPLPSNYGGSIKP